jgi:Ca-activated chloride channel family protein
MRFASPGVLWLLLLLPLLGAAMAWGYRRRRKALERFAGGPERRERFTGEVSVHRRVAKSLLWLLAAGAMIVAIARPQWGNRLEPITRRGIDAAVVVDASLSMAAEDAAPSRLAQALHSASSLIGRLTGSRVAVISFAGRAALLCPLTLDHAAARLFLDTVDVETVPAQGTSLAEALSVALRALIADDGAEKQRGKAIVIFSDGEDHEGEIEEALREVKRAGVTVHAVGCGSPRGAPIPLKDDRGGLTGYKKDRENRVVTTRLDESFLEKLALETGGRYYRATVSEVEVDEIARALAGIDLQEFGTVLRVRYEERFQVPLALAVIAFLAETLLSDRRRPKLAPAGGGERPS